jgi:Sec-independent protein translocase protein TatA
MIGFMEIISILVLFLIVYLLGKDAPKIAKKTGKNIRQLKEFGEVKNKIKKEIEELKN